MRAGYVLHSDSHWMRFHLANSIGGRVGYCRGVGAPMKNVVQGGKLMFIARGERPRRIHFWADFAGDPEVTVDEAWERFGPALGARDANEWRHLVDRLPAIRSKGRLRVLVGENAFAPAMPVELAAASVPESDNATKGWSIDDGAVDRILSLSGATEAEERNLPDQGEVFTGFVEGATKWVLVNRFERNRRARDACLAHWGTVCVVCETGLAEVYGPLAAKVVHVHHLVPLAEIGAEYTVNPVEHLRPVCPNCHAVIHAANPPLTISAVQDLLRNQRRR